MYAISLRSSFTSRASCLLLILAFGAVGCEPNEKPAQETVPSESPPRTLTEAERVRQAANQLSVGDTSAALKTIETVLAASPDNTDALAVAIEIYSSQKQFREAAEIAERVATLQPDQASSILTKAFDWRLRAGDYDLAEQNLSKALKLQPESSSLHRAMAQLLNAQGRRFEAGKHLRMLIVLGAISPEEMLGLIDISGPFSLVSFAELVDQSKISLFTLGQARYEFFQQRNVDEALDLVDQIAAKYPDSPAVSALHGRILAEKPDRDGLEAWAKRLPAGIEDHPEYWHAIAGWLTLQQRDEEAVRAYAESIRRDPTNRQALRQMIPALERLGKDEIATKLRKQLAVLDDIFRNAKNADANAAKKISGQLEQLTRPWVSTAWLEYAAYRDNSLQSRIEEFTNRRNVITSWENQSTPEAIAATRLKLTLTFSPDLFPLPKLDEVVSRPTRDPAIANSETVLNLVNVAVKRGIKTKLKTGIPTNRNEPYYLHHVNGGGLAAFDYNLDGRVDIYITHSDGTPMGEPNSEPNQLYRQNPDEQFEEIAAISGSDDRGFGQGICAGDVNQDGFDDLLIANIGKNVVLINQGDGTFREASQLLQENPAEWTSSIAIGDLNGDHLPEIYSANYVDDPKVFQSTCYGGQLDGGKMDCIPHSHDSANDRIYLANPNGTYTTWALPGINNKPNYSFAIIIANIDEKHGNDVFVTNDGDLNHFWASAPAGQASRFSLAESAGLLGCSIGKNGLSQSCMGLGTGDFDRNGRMDFHITNFYNELSNLFMQNKSGFFSDDAIQFGLQPITEKILGFGTHAVDFDNDGWQDLAALNGHVHDDSPSGIPYQMKSQLMRGTERGFAIQNDQELDDYWSTEQLGRTLAVLDFNRDGKMDLIANHLDTPVALLENQSPSGSWIQLRLVGVTSERDAIGAKVVCIVGDQSWTNWQLGGDGYMCTNESVVHFGLGNVTQIDRIEIHWPSGETQQFDKVKVNQSYLVAENAKELFAGP